MAFAQRLAAQPSLAPGRLALQGPLGAGKTTFTRHLLRALGVQGNIKSPTYAVLEPHQADAAHGGFEVLHFDAYRLNDPQEWDDAGFRELWDGPGLKLCEWPERVPELAHAVDWWLRIEPQADGSRDWHLSAPTERGAQWLRAVNA
jgi:tRNA threonylcarbamoyladenosine biosynthesis protein TsaE